MAGQTLTGNTSSVYIFNIGGELRVAPLARLYLGQVLSTVFSKFLAILLRSDRPRRSDRLPGAKRCP